MDCKKALQEADGDFETAIDVLRKKGQKVAAKRADREASEGVVLAGVSADAGRGSVVSVNCETDFVAKNESFIELTRKVLEQTGVIGEKIEIGSFEHLEAEHVDFYIHAGNKLATLVGLNKDGGEAGRNVAMQAAAMNPVALNKSEVPQDVIDRELEVGKDLARQEGKPEEMLDKIAQGRLGKFFKENTLEQQQYIRDSKLSVEGYLKGVDKELKLTGYRRVGLGV